MDLYSTDCPAEVVMQTGDDAVEKIVQYISRPLVNCLLHLSFAGRCIRGNMKTFELFQECSQLCSYCFPVCLQGKGWMSESRKTPRGGCKGREQLLLFGNGFDL